jgi:hypothetical protein
MTKGPPEASLTPLTAPADRYGVLVAADFL